jgi:EAL domain-containing protein (putative c-di-GMP-specific phosphodiesterase class I)
VALDDFGSGLSSFSYLKHMDFDYLKIDGSFIRDLDRGHTDLAMVQAIHQLGRVMGIETVAEYVDRRDVLDVVRGIGIDHAQGFALHRPEAMPGSGSRACAAAS